MAPKPQRPPINGDNTRLERARNLLAVLLRHPALLREVEEALAGLDLPEGHCAALRASLLGQLAHADVLNSGSLLDQLANSGAGEAVAWALRKAGLASAAHPDAQPAEALDGWWHFFALLRGEADLLEDQGEAKRQWIETNDPAAAQRLIGVTRALASLRRGEAELEMSSEQ